MYKHILCPVVISAIENNKEVWGDSREEETVSGWASYEGKPFWKSDTERRPKWVTEGAPRKGTPRGVTGTFFLGLHTKLHCALLILLQKAAYWNPERDHWLPGCVIWDLRLCWFATGYLSEQCWYHGQVLMGECGSQHMMTPLFAVAPYSGCWGLNLKPRCDFGLAIWRVKSQSPHLYHRKASSLGYWKATGDSACERLAHRKCSETWAIIVMTKMRFQRMVLKGSMHDCPIDILTKGSQASKIVLEAPDWDKFHSFAKEYNVSFYRRIIHFG